MQGEVFYEELAVAASNQLVQNKVYSKIFVLVDTNTKKHCLPVFESRFDLPVAKVLTIKAGEAHKTIESCVQVWEQLSEFGADRKSLLINLGGGVVTDLGGFVASTFKRGMDFVNVPTTLLSMVDASVGGKTGVDLGTLKNQVGVINQPEAVFILNSFLDTLARVELRSGYAEMLKHALIAKQELWEPLQSMFPDISTDAIKESVAVKEAIVEKDPFEQNERKKLNFGHTLGHAIESYFLGAADRKTLLHGEAIAVGMILESFLSNKLKGLSRIAVDEISTTILSIFPKVALEKGDISNILDYLKHDKKNSHGNVNFTLLTALGHAEVDVRVPNEMLYESFAYYKEL